MKQRTAKTFVEAFEWILNNAHHSFEKVFDGNGCMKAVKLKNYHECLIVPLSIVDTHWRYVRANERPFDTRMFTVNRAGRKLMGEKAK